MENLIEFFDDKFIKDDPTGSRRRLLIRRLEGSKDAYLEASNRMAAIVKSFEANMRSLEVTIDFFNTTLDKENT